MTVSAQFVVLGACLMLTVASAVCASLAYAASKSATKRLLTSSLRVELDEIHDAISKHSRLLQRVNARTMMAERRATEADAESSEEPPSDVKARLRRQIGLLPGRPAPHK